MSANLPRSPVWIIAIIVGLIAATALVAGYADRPGISSRTAVANRGDCAACPAKGTDECPKEAGMCPAETGLCPDDVCCAGSKAPSCPVAMTAHSAGSACPMKATLTAGPCGSGGCQPAR